MYITVSVQRWYQRVDSLPGFTPKNIVTFHLALTELDVPVKGKTPQQEEAESYPRPCSGWNNTSECSYST